jgi:hypothetical protein
MFKGEKTSVFRVDLVILSLTAVSLFSALWSMLWTILDASPYTNLDYYWRALVPPVVGSVVFLLVGSYKMRSGVKKEKRETPSKPKAPVNLCIQVFEDFHVLNKMQGPTEH